MNGWISTSDRLPKRNEQVVFVVEWPKVFKKPLRCVGYRKSEFYWCDELSLDRDKEPEEFYTEHVTKWQPLPEV